MNWASGASSLPYHTLLRPGILPGSASVALKKACQSASDAPSTAVNAKQCISFFSPAHRFPLNATSNTTQTAISIQMDFLMLSSAD